jgi:hypothetical protein
MLVFAQLVRVCRVMMCLNQRYRTYPKAIMMQLMLLMHQRQFDLPTWRMFVTSPAVFNEEIGEMSFAQLSRCVLGDTVKAKFQHMHMQYKLTNLYAATTDTLRTEQGRTPRKSGYYSLHKKKKEVRMVVAFMQETINAIRFKVFQVYTGDANKDNPNYLYSLTPKFEKHTDTSVMWINDIKPLAEKWMEDYQKKCTGTWAKEAGIHLVLPAFDNEARVAAKSVPAARAHQAAEAVRAAAEMKSKSVSSSESEDSDEGVDPDLEYDDSDAEDKKHTEDEDLKRTKPVVAAAPAAAAPVVLPPIVPRNTAALALTQAVKARKPGGRRNNRM